MRFVVVHKNIVNKCRRIIVYSCGLVNSWSETKALERVQESLCIFARFIREEVYVGISHYVNRLSRGAESLNRFFEIAQEFFWTIVLSINYSAGDIAFVSKMNCDP